MAKGIKRGIVGGLVLAFAAYHDSGVKELKSMSPNEIADRMFSEKKRQKAADVQLAVTQRSGSVYDAVVKNCEIKDSANSALFSVRAIEFATGRRLTNVDECIKTSLNEKEFWASSIPEKGRADEKFKEHMMWKLTNGTKVIGGVGSIMLLAGIAGFVGATRRKEGPKPSV